MTQMIMTMLLAGTLAWSAQAQFAFAPQTSIDEQRERERAERERERSQHDREMRMRSREKDDRSYRAGSSYLDKRDYDKAIEAFNHVIEEKSARADGALYWRAYAQNRLGKRDEALASLAELKKSYPNSRWLDDAKALEVEARQNSGRPVSPENASDEDLKLLALNSLVNTDPDRAAPILEKLLKSGTSPKVKERALFVLAQTRSPKARELMAQVAKGSYNPDLQLKAVEYLGIYGGKENQQTLADVYRSSNDVAVKRSILRSFMTSSSREPLLAVAKSEPNAELRVEAIRELGAMGGSAELMQLYTPDAPYEVKRAVLHGLFISGNADKLTEIIRTEKDPKIRLEAIHQLGPMGRGKTGDALAAMYAKESDAQMKREILGQLFIQGNAPAVIEVARKESDPNLKREAVQRLSLMHSKEATDYLMELLNK
jgi:HEAT repeat protein